MRKIPSRLRPLSKEQNWKTIKDEIRGLACIPENDFKVFVSDFKGHLFANCDFNEGSDAHEVFARIQGRRLEDVVLQAWIFQPGQDGHKMVGWPRDQITGARLWPPTFVEASVYRPRGSRGSCRLQANQTGAPTHSMVVNRTGRNSNVSQDGVFIQPFPAAELTMHTSFNDVGTVLAPHLSPDATNLNPYQQHLGHFSPSLCHTTELSESSSIPFNTPELSSSSRNSSISAIPDAYLPARNSNYGAFQFIAGSPYADHNLSVPSTSEQYTPANSRSQSGSSHTLQDTGIDEAYKVIIRYVKPGVTDKQLSKLLDEKLPRYGYVQHEMPKKGEGNKWSVKFVREEDAEKARERLNGISFKGDELQVTRGNGGPRRQSSS